MPGKFSQELPRVWFQIANANIIYTFIHCYFKILFKRKVAHLQGSKALQLSVFASTSYRNTESSKGTVMQVLESTLFS